MFVLARPANTADNLTVNLSGGQSYPEQQAVSISFSMNQIRIYLQPTLLIVFLGGVLFSGPVLGQESVAVGASSIDNISTPDPYRTTELSEPSRKSIQQISDKIDSLVKAKLSNEGLKRNKRSSDAVFLRRVYLDIIGRIPDLQETQSFLASKDKSKRADLIDELLNSYGRTSRQFNYWADLLRVKSRMGNGVSGQPYVDFVKDALAENQPFDEFVQEMLTASGANLAPDNGAVGYYLRDRDMPEDNMSNTIRVFLGTRLECAQCHDHPYDDWTQRQYFEMVAFTGGVSYRTANDNVKQLQKKIRSANIPEKLRGKVGQFVKSIGTGIEGGGTGLTRLPEGFLGDDGEDGEIVIAREMFEGQALTDAKIPPEPKSKNRPKKKNKRARANIRGSKDIGSREIYAAWLTDSENPRFATVIANRLWKQAMGIGLIEPVDIIEAGMEGSNPELMTYLAETMVDLDFDMKQFLRAIYLSETYQATAFAEDVPDVTEYSFPGPVVRRMSAEQIWDSLLTLVVAETDVRQTSMAGRQYGSSPEVYEKVIEMSPEELLEFAMETMEKNGKGRDKFRSARRKQMKAMRAEFQAKINAAKKKKDFTAVKELMTERAQMVSKDRRKQGQFARASELSSPAPAKHFLREFGQSDREVIDNANTEPSVPQVLSMMNGMIEKSICRDRNSLLMQNALQAEDSQECIEMVFLSMLNREPSQKEVNAWHSDFDTAAKSRNKSEMQDTFADLIWTIANSNEFIFQK